MISHPPPHPYETASTGEKVFNDPSGDLARLLTRANTRDEFEDDEQLLLVEWTELDPELEVLRQQRMVSMKQDILSDKNGYRGVARAHSLLCAPSPESASEIKKLKEKIAKIKWTALLYVCNDLMVFPTPHLKEKATIGFKDVTIKKMAEALCNWVGLSSIATHVFI